MPDRGLSHLGAPSRFPRKRFLIPSEVGVAGGLVPVAACLPQVGIPSEAFDEVLDLGYLEDLSEHEGPEVPLGLIFDGSPGAFGVEVRP